MVAPLHPMIVQTLSAQDETRFIHSEISAVDCLISQLHEKRAALMQRLNGVQAATRNLPPEVLARIFQYANPPLDLNENSVIGHRPTIRAWAYFVYTIAQVCVYWRNVAWSTPQLWATLDATLFSDVPHDRFAEVLHTHLTNSTYLPFSLKLELETLPSGHFAEVLFHSELTKRIHRLRLLLNTRPRGYGYPVNSIKYLADFQAESSSGDKPKNILSLSEISYLRKLYISWCDIIPKLPSASLTELELSRCPIDVCVGILMQCTQLVKFRSNVTYEAREGSSSLNGGPADHPLILHHLEEFTWSHRDAPCARRLLRRLRLPNIERLTWYDESSGDDSQEAFQALASNIPKNMGVLTLGKLVHWDYGEMNGVFESLSGVHSLNLEGCDNSMVLTLMYRLGRVDNSTPSYLPSLSHLKIDGYSKPPESWTQTRYDVEICQQFPSIAGNRLRGGFCEEFYVEFHNAKVRWPSGVRNNLCELIAEGYDLMVAEDNAEVDWLDSEVDNTSEDDENSDEDEDEEEEEEEDNFGDDYEVTWSDLEF
ncbi:hypothetical protein NP233_g134 [Leucocoprinus birnbaumii]|uniref:F-box domain-containing protein n=1 Tax=Leucocoprinus birnbaumii TaxID=56174 RepID=A0AAD5Z0H8_9AGAR|nr:hypothetical protein NP233_g134 [Leucocoprinus birnbaumii]